MDRPRQWGGVLNIIFEPDTVSVRGWFTGPKGSSRPWQPEPGSTEVGPSAWLLVFDTETTTDEAQTLRFGTWRAYFGDQLMRQGVFYHPDRVSPDELSTLNAETDLRGWELHEHREWLDNVFLVLAVDLSAMVVGHNLFFDVSRVALGHITTRSRSPRMKGGFSFQLSDNPTRPRLLAKRAAAAVTFYQFAVPSSRTPEQRAADKRGEQVPSFRGFFVDTASLATALLGGRHSLSSLGKTLDTEHQKLDVDLDRPVDSELLEYAMADVTVTFECFTALRQRYESYHLDLPVYRIVSEASVGKAHLKQIGIQPWAYWDAPECLIAALMETYYGGRTECRIRRLPIPGVYVDFLSQYPTVYVLLNMWRFQIASHIEVVEADPREIEAFLDNLTVDDLYNPDTWPTLAVIAEIEPDGDLLPTRARYNPNSTVDNVAVVYRDGGPAQWYTLPDLIVSKLDTRRTPRIKRALRFEPGMPQDDLRDIEVAGSPDFRVNPYEEDLVQRLIELRSVAKANKKSAESDGDRTGAAFWDAIQQGLKITANSGSYGIGIELNTTDHDKPVDHILHLTDGTSESIATKETEQPGSYFNPIIATITAAGGRLLLGMLIHQVQELGGTYVFCDTDSLFPAATPDGRTLHITDPTGTLHTIPTLTWEQVDRIIKCFESLNPYDPELIPGSILKIEDLNFDPETGRRRQLYAYSIASKRYAITIRQPDGTHRLARESSADGTLVAKRSEHGLGHLVGPAEGWEDELWEYTINTDMGFEWVEPAWFDQPALGQTTINTKHDAALFNTLNEHRSYQRQIRPGGFLTTAHAHPAGPDRGLLIAPYSKLPHSLHRSDWTDRATGETGLRIEISDPHLVVEGCVPVLDYRHYMKQYRTHPEWKMHDPTLHRRGLLETRRLSVAEISHIGKETPSFHTDLPVSRSGRCAGCGGILTGRQRKWCSEACRKSAHRQT